LIDMAYHWARLADEQERATDLRQEQQQQIQPKDDKKE
jgi:hypothetical protein